MRKKMTTKKNETEMEPPNIKEEDSKVKQDSKAEINRKIKITAVKKF